MADKYLDHIVWDGEDHLIQDTEARVMIKNLETKMGLENEKIYDNQKAIDEAKVSKEEGMGLTSNDFSDYYKNMVDNLEEGVTSHIDFDGNTIIQDYATGKKHTVVVNGDGTIDETIVSTIGEVTKIRTIFNPDGSIDSIVETNVEEEEGVENVD